MASIGQARPATTVRTPLFILGVALALVAFLAMFAFGVVFTARSQNSGQLRVVVAARDIQPREPITPDMLSLATLPATAAPPKAFVRTTDLTGYSAVVEIYKGQTMTPNIVSSSPDQLAGPSASTFLPIPEGYIAITVPKDKPQGVVVLRGARILTMKGSEVIPKGDIVVKDNRIVAVGAQGKVKIPDGFAQAGTAAGSLEQPDRGHVALRCPVPGLAHRQREP